ncbi:MAG: ATP synthase F1 subunit epsilon [Verrucomicrobiae bacterium]|nr:ATP synthase F1 subunit epsilon [Verrucomicrobiae bacterium]
MGMRLEIVTPEKRTFSDVVDLVVLPGIEGEMGVLENHADLITTLTPGELRYTKGGHEYELAVGEGVVEITGKSVAVLTDMAVGEADIDEAAVTEALERAEAALKANHLGDEEIATVQAAIQKSMAQLHLKRKRRRV